VTFAGGLVSLFNIRPDAGNLAALWQLDERAAARPSHPSCLRSYSALRTAIFGGGHREVFAISGRILCSHIVLLRR
jgi:hypothetical protein